MGSDTVDDFNRLGWAVARRLVPPEQIQRLCAGIDQLERWAHDGGPGLHHFEQTEAGPRAARSEKFADDHHELGQFIRGSAIGETLEALFGEPSVLFKEKVNYKYPGGGGFAPHQDATAYRFVDHHISVMVPLDDATEASGCLWFAPGYEQGAMPSDERGRITNAVVAQLDWRPVPASPGDLVFFDSYAPHRSETNTTRYPRRVLYLTYNAASRGDFRATYYADKEAEFAREGDTFGDTRVRISVSDDFLGKPVAR